MVIDKIYWEIEDSTFLDQHLSHPSKEKEACLSFLFPKITTNECPKEKVKIETRQNKNITFCPAIHSSKFLQQKKLLQ